MANLKDVAQASGVSVMTVSRVINRNGYVKEETRKRVEEAVKKLNYYPNNLGRGLNQGRVNIIAAMAPIEGGPIESHPYYTQLLYGVEEILIKQSYDLLLSTQRSRWVDGVLSFDYFRPYMEHKADGLVLMGAILSSDDVDFIRKNRIPLCIIGDRPKGPTIDVVDTNNRQNIKILLEKAYQLGHRKIAFGGYDEANFNVKERYQGYREFLKEKGLDFHDEYCISCSLTQDHDGYLFRKYQQMDDKPTALICSTDSFAVDVLKEARDAGLFIPGDLSVTGFDGIPLGQYIEPRLTTMVQDVKGMGCKAAELVLRRLDDPELHGESYFFDAEYLEGESLGPAG